MKHFRLPRKTKKFLKGKLWLYPADKEGNSLMAQPASSQEDYTAFKQGVVSQFPDSKNASARRKELRNKLDREITISDTCLKTYVDAIFREDFRNSSYQILLQAKQNPRARRAYYNFINAYGLLEKGESSFGNICCLSVDRAEELLKKK
jgi:hypothetical protein